LNIIQI